MPKSKATAKFRVPAGWHVVKEESSNRAGDCTIEPDMRRVHDVYYPSMRIVFGYLDPTVPATEAGQLKGYLEAVRSDEDDTVRAHPIGSVQVPGQGMVTLYSIHSDLVQQYLHAEIRKTPYDFGVILTYPRQEHLQSFHPAFEQVLQSVTFQPGAIQQ